MTSIDSLVQACGTGVTKDGVRSAITRLVKLGFITNVSTKTGRLITIVNWDKYQGVSYGDPKANTNGDTMANPIDTPKTPQRHPKDTPPNNNNKNDKNNKNDEKDKNIVSDTQDDGTDDSDWWANYQAANGEED